ncbi:uncharacterized protein LOC135112893 isoform X2 [Scylla paramamosain]|uniref:uncharacterized protein LOC135112893 isoform X2 n=1 Tax=Scylla paramamosain TaxID=85552 RepID=UPI0030832ECE
MTHDSAPPARDLSTALIRANTFQALASCGLHPAHDTSIHAGRDLTPSMYYSGSPARPYHHSPHTLERPPHAGLFPASPPGQMATQCVAASGRGSRHTPEGSSPPDHCHGPHTPERPPHAGGFPASPPGQMATQDVAAATPPEGSPPPDHCQYHSPVVQYHSSISPPFSRSPPWSPDGGRRASPTGWRSPCYQHHHHHHYTAPPRDRWSPPGRRSSPPDRRASPERGRSPPSRSPRYSPRAIPVYFPHRARAMGTLPLRQYLMTSTGFHKGEEQRVSPPQPAPPPPTPWMPSLWVLSQPCHS